ncbi:hypothetical protein Tco_0892272 [Tanacetum coccineum]|uniref:Uncharacterized protein n=1 Tax=Tanacetum coccineum TaxID=301880 RepID=A0ABQ5C5E6_9ASTR
MAIDDPIDTTINASQGMKKLSLYGTILTVALTTETSTTLNHTIEKPPTVPKEKKGKKTGKGKQKAIELETISEAVLTEAEQLKIITKRSRKETHNSYASGSGANEGTDDEDDDKQDDDENAQDDEDEDKNDDDKTAQDDIGKDGVDWLIGENPDEDATDVEDQGNETDKDTNANLEGRDDVMTDVILPQVQATQEIEDTHVTLTPVNPDGQQHSSSVSSGFVSNMLNPNQDTDVDAIFGHTDEATSLIDIPVTAIAEPSFFAPTNPLEDNFSEFKQTNLYAEALSSIPGIVDQYLANKLKEAIDVAVQLKYDRIREILKLKSNNS